MEFKFRWFALLSTIPISAITYQIFGNQSFNLLTFSFLLGMLSGFLLDIIGHAFSLWEYPRQPFRSESYFFLVVPAWGAFGVQINILWNLLRLWIKDGEWIISVSIVGMILTGILFIVYEIPNLKRRAWIYRWSLKKVFIGWPLLIIFFRLTYKIFILFLR